MLRRGSVPTLLVTAPASLRYLAGVGDVRWLLLAPKEAAFMPARLSETAVRSALKGVARVLVPETGWGALVPLLKRAHAVRLGIEGEAMSAEEFARLKAAMGTVALVVPAGRPVERLRTVKTRRELGALRKAADITRQVDGWLPFIIVPGASERDTAARIDCTMRLAGADAPAFDTIVLAGPATAMPHGVPSGRRIRSGDLVLVDFGARVDGYHSDCTRTFACLKASERQRRAYGAVRRAYEAGRRAVRPGRPGGDPFRAACRALGRMDKRFIHGLGHGVGLEIHEAPNLVRDGRDMLAAGQVLTVEPGVYFPGWGGIRLEDTFLVTRRGAASLTGKPSQELPVIGLAGKS